MLVNAIKRRKKQLIKRFSIMKSTKSHFLNAQNEAMYIKEAMPMSIKFINTLGRQ
jgi:hypothetical protein